MTPTINKSKMSKDIMHIFTIKNFKDSYLELLEKWYQRNNLGKGRAKPKLGLLDGVSYDKTYKAVEKIIYSYPNENQLLSHELLDKIVKILKKYKGKISPNKLKYINEIINYINITDGYIDDIIHKKLTNKELIQRKTENDARKIMKILESRLECPEIKTLYELYELRLNDKEKFAQLLRDEAEPARGLPNSGNYCFLNAAIQQMFTLKSFRTKVLNAKVDDAEISKKKYKELWALKQIFNYLNKNINLDESAIKKYLGRDFLGYKGIQEESAEHMQRIMERVKSQLQKLKLNNQENIKFNNQLITSFNAHIKLIDLIKETCEEHKTSNSKSPITLRLKSDQFIIILGRSEKKAQIQEVNETLDLSSLYPDLLHIRPSQTSPPLPNPKFNLISVTIHAGSTIHSGHYYVYKRFGSKWRLLNDSSVVDVKWDDIKGNIKNNATVLIYKKS